ncbi:MAG: hypothetical protein CR967_03565 [Proteobacteria bacterium]|nr:MAG: hypothetical protein CR967_03565 [Pseudomonadota bacterium]
MNAKKILSLLKEINDKQLMQSASSLSFHTILSIIPILLISLSIFTKLPSFDMYYTKIKEFIFSSLLPSNQEAFSSYIEKFLENTVGMGIFGFVVVLFTSTMFFMEYEYTINKILKAPSRTFWQGLSSYWTLITLAPMGLGISFFVSNYLQNLLNSFEYTSWINFLAIVPYLIIWGLFFATYMISASVSLSPKKVGIASFVTSLVWYTCKSLFVYYVVYNKTYMSIYGSFSIAIFFLIWIYVSWIIFLYGVKLCAFLNEEKIQNS